MASLADRLDGVNRAVGSTVRWLAVAMVALQFGIVLLRYVFGVSFIFLDESVLYMHCALFMLGAGFTLLLDGHVRVDIFYGRWSARGKARMDVLGALLALIPGALVIAWFTWPFVFNSWKNLDGAISVGGIPASFLLKSLIPAFCLLLALQGLACLLRDLARLKSSPKA
ncbi:MAG: TRAP transporter small permease subunit [Alphaproteobacteria bacterium]|nr:TRAP transporter small permease subunit [Alphaproteobacteria bacterium]